MSTIAPENYEYSDGKQTTYKDPDLDLPKIQATTRHYYCSTWTSYYTKKEDDGKYHWTDSIYQKHTRWWG